MTAITARSTVGLLVLFPVLMIMLASCGPKRVPGSSKSIGSHAKNYPSTGKIPWTQRPYVINGRMYYPLPSAEGYMETGTASWYGPGFHGRKTANGEKYDMHDDTSAHRTLPMNTLLLVENLENGYQTIVRVNDRGPFCKERVVDLSYAAARKLGLVGNGTARVRLTALGEAEEIRKGGEIHGRFLPHEDFNSGEFYVQIASFEDMGNASQLRDRLLTAGNKTVIQAFDRGDKIFYRVQVRGGTTMQAALQKEKLLSASGYPDAYVIAR